MERWINGSGYNLAMLWLVYTKTPFPDWMGYDENNIKGEI